LEALAKLRTLMGINVHVIYFCWQQQIFSKQCCPAYRELVKHLKRTGTMRSMQPLVLNTMIPAHNIHQRDTYDQLDQDQYEPVLTQPFQEDDNPTVNQHKQGKQTPTFSNPKFCTTLPMAAHHAQDTSTPVERQSKQDTDISPFTTPDWDQYIAPYIQAEQVTHILELVEEFDISVCTPNVEDGMP
jgi:hypothetical protein